MSIKVIKKEENVLFKRQEIVLELNYEGKPTPNRKSVLNEVGKVLKTDENLISIIRIAGIFGLAKSIITAHVYKNRKTLEENEPKHIIKRYIIEKPKEEKKEQPKKEEVKVEKKEEKK